MQTEKTIGYLLVSGAIGVFTPYLLLTFSFNYPNILREESGEILTQFHAGGASLIFTWLAFALLGLPLLLAYVLIGQRFEKSLPQMRWVTTIGVVSAVVQMVGLLRWVFVVPILAAEYVNGASPEKQEAIGISFKLIHQFGGVLLGEHLGQLFTVIWTFFTASALLSAKVIPAWLAWWGFISAAIYLLAQAELFATVIPGFPVIDMAGLIGSTGWLLWLFLLGLRFIRMSKSSEQTFAA